MHNDGYHYPGEELEIFESAVNWKKYIASKILPFIHGKVLEVGAGIGDTTKYLVHRDVQSWLCLEPDRQQFLQLMSSVDQNFNAKVTANEGTLDVLDPHEKFDTILYIDVLEHIEDDQAEILKASRHLNEGGRIIILSPAFQYLFSPFDKAIGHYRRYSKKTLRKAAAFSFLEEEKIFFLESAGLLLLFLNKFIVRKKYPEKKHVIFWQKIFIPVSRVLDKIIFYSAGKSIIGIWRYRT